jgi:hypothetical protein
LFRMKRSVSRISNTMTQEQQLNICGLERLKIDGRNIYFICDNYWIQWNLHYRISFQS